MASYTLLDSSIVAQRHLRFLGYALGQVDPDFANSHADSLNKLKALSLPVNPHYQIAENIEQVIEICNSWQQKRYELDYQIDGMVIKTDTERVVKARKIMVELLLARCPDSEEVQKLAEECGVKETRITKKNKDCTLCGLCVRMCEEQMMAKAIGFRGRGENRSIGTPFDIKSEVCRLCGGCIYVCPACQLRCTYTEPEKAICGGCTNLSPPCLEKEEFSDMMCYMDPCVACETSGR